MPTAKKIQQPVTDETAIAVMGTNIDYIKNDIADIKQSLKDMRQDYVSHTEFLDAIQSIKDQIKPLKEFIYGLVTLILLAVVGGILSLVIR